MLYCWAWLCAWVDGGAGAPRSQGLAAAASGDDTEVIPPGWTDGGGWWGVFLDTKRKEALSSQELFKVFIVKMCDFTGSRI